MNLGDIEDFQGRPVLVTCASAGIREAAARAFARNGARVVVHYDRSQAEARADDLTKRGEAKRVGIEERIR